MRVLSLFSGIGAWEKALDRLNIPYELVGYCDNNKYASFGYSLIHNVPESLNIGDITTIDEKTIPDFDLLVYSPPCQAFSTAGKQLGFEDTRGILFFDAFRIIKEKKPKYAIMENVKGLTQKKFTNEFNQMLTCLEDAGYTNYYKVLNAKDYGIPQNRERVFIVSIRNDIEQDFEFPVGVTTDLKLRDLLDKEVEEKYYLGQASLNYMDRETRDGRNHWDFGHYHESEEIAKCIPANIYKGIPYNVVKIKDGTKKGYTEFTPTTTTTLDLTAPGSSTRRGRVKDGIVPTLDTGCQVGVFEFPETKSCSLRTRTYINQPQQLEVRKDNLSNSITTVTKDYLVLEKDVLEPDAELPIVHNIYGGFNETEPRIFNEYSPSIRTSAGGGHIPSVCTNDENKVEKTIGNYRIRKLTPLECLRLMGFDDEDHKILKENKISDTQIYKMAGNSICIPVIVAIYKNLFRGKA